MDRFIRLMLLFGSMVYFAFCIIGGLEVNRGVHQWMIVLFIVFGVVVVIRCVVLLLAAYRERKGGERSLGNDYEFPFVTIVVPAFNEEKVIGNSLVSLANIDYPNYEVIVVDDGSSDGTVSISRQVAARYPNIEFRIISQSNSGKSWALNTGILHARGEFILCVDADSVLEPGVLKVSIPQFEDPKMGAIGGFVDIVNDASLIARFQQIEYVIGLNFLRQGLSRFNMVTVIPGPIGIFRATALRQAGGYKTSGVCYAEDADLTIRLLANGWRVKGETRAIARTEAPDTLYHLLRQRYRWRRGLFQAWIDNVANLLQCKEPSRVVVALVVMFESFMFDVISFGITLFGLASFLEFGEFRVFVAGFIVLVVLDLSIFYFCNFNQSRLAGRLWLFMLSKISYAYVLQAWGVLALFDEWLTASMSWDKLDRIGGVPLKN